MTLVSLLLYVVGFHDGSIYQLLLYLCRNEMKREGSGRGNWGAPEDELAP